jgi:adenylate cyclase class IV
MRREVEAKFKLRNESEAKSAVSRLTAFGFIAQTPRMELDYALDTQDWDCRRHGLILRFRRVAEDDCEPFILVTLKEKRQHDNFQDYDETELKLGSPEQKNWGHIQSVLESTVGLRLPEDLVDARDFVQIIKEVRAGGFSRHRILLEKRRLEFRRGRISVTIDSFPDGIGTYLEIEAHDPASIEQWIGKLKLGDFEPEVLDYGEILKRQKQRLESEVQQRTAVFDDSIRQLIAENKNSRFG